MTVNHDVTGSSPVGGAIRAVSCFLLLFFIFFTHRSYTIIGVIYVMKEAEIMSNSTKLLDDEKIFVEEIKIYIEALEEQSRLSQEIALIEARKALKRTGVIAKNGKTKKKIVTWE